MLSEAAPSAVAGAAVASEDAPNEQEELLVSQFSMILDEYIACHPVTTPALSEADVRFATAKYLLSRRRGGVVWPGENAARLAAILLILFVELLASSAITILGLGQEELYALMERAVREGGVSRDELVRTTVATDLVGNAVTLAQSDQLRRLWEPSRREGSGREGSGSSLHSVSEDGPYDGGDDDDEAERAPPADVRAPPRREWSTDVCGPSVADQSIVSEPTHSRPPPQAGRSLALGAALFVIGLSLWFLSEKNTPLSPTLRWLPPTVYSSLALGGFPLMAISVRPDDAISVRRLARGMAALTIVCGGLLTIVFVLDALHFATAVAPSYDAVNAEQRNPIVLVLWFGTAAIAWFFCWRFSRAGKMPPDAATLEYIWDSGHFAGRTIGTFYGCYAIARTLTLQYQRAGESMDFQFIIASNTRTTTFHVAGLAVQALSPFAWCAATTAERRLRLQQWLRVAPTQLAKEAVATGGSAAAAHATPSFEISYEDVEVDMKRLIGRGGMSAVFYGAWHGNRVAVKVLKGRVRRQALLDEAAVLSRLRHPCICSFFGVVTLRTGQDALVLEYMARGSLAEYLDLVLPRSRDRDQTAAKASGGSGHVTVPRAAPRHVATGLLMRVAREVASGLLYLHRMDYLHRDVKTANILLTADLHATLSDFGLAKQLRAGSEGGATGAAGSSSDHSTDGSIGNSGRAHTMGVGTPRYMAPEVIRSTNNITRVYHQSCDVYSFAYVLWEMMHRRVAFDDVPTLDEIVALVSRGVRPPIELPDDRAGFAPIIAASWAHTPSTRPTMANVLESIGQLIGPVGWEPPADAAQTDPPGRKGTNASVRRRRGPAEAATQRAL